MEDIDPSFQAKTIELKRALGVHGQLPAHRCQHCEPVLSVLNPPLPGETCSEELFNVTETKAQIGELARLGCKWWSLISSLIRFLLAQKPTLSTAKDHHHIDPYDDLDPELPPALREHRPLWDNAFWNGSHDEQLGKQDLQTVSVTLNRWAPLDLKMEHTVGVFMLGCGSMRANLMFVGHLNSLVRKSEQLVSHINTQPGSVSAFALSRHWLEYCTHVHGCGILDAPTSMPRILIDVKKLGDDNDVRITETGPQIRCPIQDAIKVTRELGFEYLWIDALCIVQDDDLEKAHDIVHMHNIYRNAAFTIIASRSANVTEGFLQLRKAAGAHAPKTIFSVAGDDEANVEANNVIAVLDRHESYEPWDNRAWTLQERLSSGRFLMFGNFQTDWSCRRDEHPYNDCDGWLLHRQRKSFGDAHQERYSLATDIMNQKTTHLDRRSLLQTWYIILKCYAGREITYPKDRLPAISSIARAFARVLDDEYVCGHWKSNLHADLLWINEHIRLETPEISWSWASSSGPISYHRDSWDSTADADFRVLGFTPTFVSNEDPYGAADSAILTLRGLLVALPCSDLPPTTPPTAELAPSFDADQSLDEYKKAQDQLALRDAHQDLKRIVRGEANCWYEFHWDREGILDGSDAKAKGLRAVTEAACESPVFLFASGRFNTWHRNFQTLGGLLLRYLGRQDKFKRVGCFLISPWGHPLMGHHGNDLETARKVLATRIGLDGPEITSEGCTDVIRELWGGIENVRTVNLI
ncbi:heterokaryon incompatibility protein-domain-containing protein [Apiospora hydei]|uniref:Heterokaryon incompatibility protein-domain-containing protein n=1 Tax=Apiospora hydei TaxID=1337664 RepID=A0ABR1X8U1_9PEZI